MTVLYVVARRCRRAPEALLCGLLFLGLTSFSAAQDLVRLPVPKFRIEASEVGLASDSRLNRYLGVVGRASAWLGTETGEAEVWVHPLKIARGFQLDFLIPEYPEAVPGRELAVRTVQRPGITTIIYSHATFTVRQHILVPLNEPGLLLLLDVECFQPMEILVKFESVLQFAWPGSLGGQYVSWNDHQRAFVLSESRRMHNALIGSPMAVRGSSHPAHALPDAPSQMVIPLVPEVCRREFIPIVVAAGIAPREEVSSEYSRLLENAGSLYLERRQHYMKLRESGVRVVTPDKRINLALEWARVNLEEQRVANPDLGSGLVAGWGPSGKGFRPGFGWFFGGDAAINTWAMSALGMFEGTAEGLRFLARYQREDGKIPHEISQSAGRIPWFTDFPYAYYHADTTPHWLVALGLYYRATSDQNTLQELWPAAKKAYRWCLTAETDGDGIIENTVGGLGAVEVGELGSTIHQDIYLAATWLKALEEVAYLAETLGESDLARQALELRARGLSALNDSYWLEEAGYYAFGILQGGSKNDSLTVWPSAAAAFGLLEPDRGSRTLATLASARMSSDWGCRMLDARHDLYRPTHYNMGAVWPFVTGFAALGQYRYDRPWSGFILIQALAALGLDWSPGRFPELLSGRFYRPLDEAVPQQFFSASALPNAVLRGLLGWEPDAPSGRLKLSPQLPADWEFFRVSNLSIGRTQVDVTLRQEVNELELRFEKRGPDVSVDLQLSVPSGATEVGLSSPSLVVTRKPSSKESHLLTHFLLQEGTSSLRFFWKGGLRPVPFPLYLEPGEPSSNPRILDFDRQGDDWIVTLEGLAGSTARLKLVGEPVVAAGEELTESGRGVTWLHVDFPKEDSGFVRRRIVLSKPR